MRRDIEQAGVLQGSLNLVVGPDQRIIPVAADVLVELLVLLVLDLLGLTGPESGRGIYLLPLADLGIRLLGLLSLLRGLRGLDLPDLDRDADMVGVLLDDASDLPVVEELLLVILYMKDNPSRSSRWRRCRCRQTPSARPRSSDRPLPLTRR